MPSPSPRRFATVLRRQRHAQGLTQTDLAEQAQMSRRAIVDLERGASQPIPLHFCNWRRHYACHQRNRSTSSRRSTRPSARLAALPDRACSSPHRNTL